MQPRVIDPEMVRDLVHAEIFVKHCMLVALRI
jgi:hypothetical protein